MIGAMVDPSEHDDEADASDDRARTTAERRPDGRGDDSRHAPADVSTARLDAALRLLQEAVFAARGGGSLAPTSDDPTRLGGCGLGAGPNLDVAVLGAGASETARAAAALLWPAGLDESRAARVREVIAGWVKRQDGLDRRRNHFIKDFRGEHGFDRTTYSDEIRAAYEHGVEAVNADNRARHVEAARAVLSV
jgi:hypothetical protein